MSVVDVGLAPSLVDRRIVLQEMLGPGFRIGEGSALPIGVVVLDDTSCARIAEIRRGTAELGIIVLLDEDDDRTPRSIVALIEAGADVCVVAPGTAGLAAHVRALAAHHPQTEASRSAGLSFA